MMAHAAARSSRPHAAAATHHLFRRAPLDVVMSVFSFRCRILRTPLVVEENDCIINQRR